MCQQGYVENIYICIIESFFIDLYSKSYGYCQDLQWNIWWYNEWNQCIGDEEIFFNIVFFFVGIIEFNVQAYYVCYYEDWDDFD